MSTYHGIDVPGTSKIELERQFVAMLKLVAVVGAHAKYELDSKTVEPNWQDSGYPCNLSAQEVVFERF